MPFTLAHAAAALPLRRMGLVWSALLIGTMAPDFEYFLRMNLDHGYGHTLAGVFLISLPLALITLWLFHTYVKIPLIELLPFEIRRRLASDAGFRFGGGLRFSWIVFSILVGIATHLLWDSFTHPNTWAWRNWAMLRQTHSLFIIGTVPTYKILQHGSTLVGVAVIALCVWRWYWRSEVSTAGPDLPSRNLIVGGMILIAFAGALIRALATVGVANHATQKTFAGVWVVTMIALMWWELVAYGIWRRRSRTK